MKAILKACLPCLVAVSSAAAREIVVSPEGLSPQAALSEARVARSESPQESVVVRVKSGAYRLDEPLVFTADDSGIVWRGEGEAVFCGGGPISGWSLDAPGVVSAPAPKDADGRASRGKQATSTRRIRKMIP